MFAGPHDGKWKFMDHRRHNLPAHSISLYRSFIKLENAAFAARSSIPLVNFENPLLGVVFFVNTQGVKFSARRIRELITEPRSIIFGVHFVYVLLSLFGKPHDIATYCRIGFGIAVSISECHNYFLRSPDSCRYGCILIYDYRLTPAGSN